jgi:hypothetical protein
MFGGHAPYTERQARGFHIFMPGSIPASAVGAFKDLSFQAPPSILGVRIVGANGSMLRTGRKGHLRVPYDCHVVGTRLMADRSGSIVFDIYRTTYANLPARQADTLTPLTIGRPTLNAQQTRQDFALYGWTTRLVENDILAFDVLSVSGSVPSRYR